MSNTNNKVKVVGYAQRVFYNDGIEYRNFSPDLVGNQLASNGGTPLFTMGNFAITTNLDPKLDKTYLTNKFSNFVTLSDLSLTQQQAQALLDDNANVILNLDKTNLKYYALFGSLAEYVRVSLEQIIINWPASLYVSPTYVSNNQMVSSPTFENYYYDSISEISTFKVFTNTLTNNFEINYLLNGSIIDTFSSSNNIRNLTVNYSVYSIFINNVEYDVIGFTGATSLQNSYIYFQVNGNPFSGLGVSSNVSYHIKPNSTELNKFFNSLPDLQYYLLNRQTSPLYTSKFKYPVKTDDGVILYVTDTITWPVSDGYNIDFSTSAYVDYASKLLNIATDNDLYSSNLMNRFLVSESITSFDTTPVHLSDLDQDTSGKKVNKTLNVYGRSFDDINNLITGIEFANTVTYDKLDNTPDIYLKNLSRVLGWEIISSVVENDLLKSYVTPAPSQYSGVSVGYTPVEADIELWRRLILNTPWLWKSKGARKSIEFLLKFIGAPQGLVHFNEYIYKADAPIDVDLFRQILKLNGLDTDLSIYPIDENGYPSPLPNTPDMYFQNNGLWYRETGGTGSTIDIVVGNNPHVGPYDGGFKYINQFRNLIPNFSAVTISSSTSTTGTANLFTNYGLGVISNYSGATYVDVTDVSGNSLDNCVVFVSEIIPDPHPSLYVNDCGCESPQNDDSLSICLSGKTLPAQPPCPKFVFPTSDNVESGIHTFYPYQYNIDGSVYLNQDGAPVPKTTYYTSKNCCKSIGGTSFLYNTVDPNTGMIVNSGYVCCDKTGKCGCSVTCKWMVNTTPISLPPDTSTYSGPQSKYLTFTKPDGTIGIVMPDGCNCVANYTTAVPNVTDPNTGEVGYACKLTSSGLADILGGTYSQIYNFYQQKTTGKINCYVNTLPNLGPSSWYQ